MADNTPAVAFFLGAGASIEADVPDTAGLITKFLESTNNSSAAAFIDQLTQWAAKNERTVDIELVLATLDSLAQWEENLFPAWQHRRLCLRDLTRGFSSWSSEISSSRRY